MMRVFFSVLDLLTVVRAANGLVLFVYILSLDAADLFRVQFMIMPVGVLLTSLFWSLPHEIGVNRREALQLQVMLLLAINLLPLLIIAVSGHLPNLLFFLAFAITTFENYTPLRRRHVRERLLTIILLGEIVGFAILTYGYMSGLGFVTVFSGFLMVRVLSFARLSFLIGVPRRRVRLSNVIAPRRVVKYVIPRLGSAFAIALLANVTPQIATFTAFVRLQTLFQMTMPTLVRLVPKAYHLGFALVMFTAAAVAFYVFMWIFLGHGGDALVLVVFALTIATLFLAETAHYLKYLKTQDFSVRNIFIMPTIFMLGAIIIWQAGLRAEVFFLFNAIMFFIIYNNVTWPRILKGPRQ